MIQLFAKIAVPLCMVGLNGPSAIAQALILECSLSGQAQSAPFTVDVTSKTVSTSGGTVLAQVSTQSITWRESGAVRTISRDTGMVFRRLPDGSYFQIGQCRPVER